MSNTFSAPASLSDENLFRLCRMYGMRALQWRQKFIGLLPEVNRRKLYEKKGFHSIFEFAAKLAGVSKEQLGTVINLEKDFEDKPILKKLLVTGEVSINKLVRIQSVATTENQEFWATQVQLLPNRALETLVRDERKISEQNVEENQNRDGFQEPLFEANELHVQPHTSTSSHYPELSHEVKQRLFKLQAKGIDINQLLIELLDQHEEDIQQEKEQITQAMSEKAMKRTPKNEGKKSENQSKNGKKSPPKPSRYIPKKVINILKKEHGDKCSIPTCDEKSQQKHHIQRFGLISKIAPEYVHDSKYLAPLCKEHHQIAHTIDIQYHEVRQKVLY